MNHHPSRTRANLKYIVSVAASRGVSMTVLSLALSACSMLPMQHNAATKSPSASTATDTPHPAHQTALKSSYTAFARGQEDAALKRLDAIINDGKNTAGARQEALLARALIHASSSTSARDAESARADLNRAASLNADTDTDALGLYFANAVDQILNAEDRIQTLRAQKSILTRDNAELASNNAQLKAKEAELKATLDKLRKLTLGSTD